MSQRKPSASLTFLLKIMKRVIGPRTDPVQGTIVARDGCIEIALANDENLFGISLRPGASRWGKLDGAFLFLSKSLFVIHS